MAKYCNKKSKNDQKQIIIDNTEHLYENRGANEIKKALESFSTKSHSIKYFLTTTIDAGDNKYNKLKIKSPLYQNSNIGRGCWKTVICINAQTNELHSEPDVTYTTITVPKQSKLQSKYSFVFKINDNDSICLLMNYGVHFLFSGLFLVHRQKCEMKKDRELFFNFGSYGNNELFTHLRKTMERQIFNNNNSK